MTKCALRIAAAVAILCSIQLVSAFTVPTTPSGYVNDYANVLSAQTKQTLEEELRVFTASTSNEIAVVVVPSLDGEVIESYAVKLFESWKIGDEAKDNGILLLVAVEERKLRIEVGYGLEGALPDILAKQIIDVEITPSFKTGGYDQGVLLGVRAIMRAIEGEYVGIAQGVGTGEDFESLITGIFFFGFFALQFLGAILARSKSWWAGGIIGGGLGGGAMIFGLFGGSLLVGLITTTVLVLLGLFFDYIVSNAYKQSTLSGGGVPWWAGGGTGGRGGSFGGFSGGSSGGGGASGSW